MSRRYDEAGPSFGGASPFVLYPNAYGFSAFTLSAGCEKLLWTSTKSVEPHLFYTSGVRTGGLYSHLSLLAK